LGIHCVCCRCALKREREGENEREKERGEGGGGERYEGWERDEELEKLGRGGGELGGMSHRYRYSNTQES